jgi:hypothetical protein
MLIGSGSGIGFTGIINKINLLYFFSELVKIAA